MSIEHDQSGRRSIQVEAEVPGTPAQVWEAIATGPGIGSWFYPTDLEERVGGGGVSGVFQGATRTREVLLTH